MSPIQRGLKDRHPYVRRTAVMGVLKVYNFDADAVRNAGAVPGCPHWRQWCSERQVANLFARFT